MQIKSLLTVLATWAVVSDAASISGNSPFSRALRRRAEASSDSGERLVLERGFQKGGDDSKQNFSGPRLNPDLVQENSSKDGSPLEDGQSPSETDNANFINFCKDKTLTNGQQHQDGSCNGIPMGEIPSTSNMVSAIFTSPQNGDKLVAEETFKIQIQMSNFAPGTFTNPKVTYYSAPQHLNRRGHIIGHTHVTVQSTGSSLNPTTPLDPQTFVFFKGINDEGNGKGLLTATVEGGLPVGNYRLCSMVSSANHQPVLMPVAQRGAQDDCIRFSVTENGDN
ncbi:unnamed protein product [Clonostachys byssicola]|uniref:Extracellular protein n=1 Tax=Clonostachys byssicola TaxID=160290 RepID=A0A9N9ULJ0_9HYPO|nr:unnamed protein product [Clonostachys byssicola]